MDLELADGNLDRWTDRPTEGWMDKWIDRQPDGWMVGCTNGWTDKHILLQICVDASKDKNSGKY